ncbi:hypothetical protein PR048_026017 [Dryococelus australis]|uniref:Uncharacterized protein n=1 Tax=Dryococelus australis TaxID=614101 RepID=A0ABQ9GK55_9NEOP|nr:hypothetical protein PR048_026017 [Dryococelus australis]
MLLFPTPKHEVSLGAHKPSHPIGLSAQTITDPITSPDSTKPSPIRPPHQIAPKHLRFSNHILKVLLDQDKCAVGELASTANSIPLAVRVSTIIAVISPRPKLQGLKYDDFKERDPHQNQGCFVSFKNRPMKLILPWEFPKQNTNSQKYELAALPILSLLVKDSALLSTQRNPSAMLRPAGETALVAGLAICRCRSKRLRCEPASAFLRSTYYVFVDTDLPPLTDLELQCRGTTTREEKIHHEEIPERPSPRDFAYIGLDFGAGESQSAESRDGIGDHGGGVVVRLLVSRLGEPGSIPGFSHVGFRPNNAAGRQVFSGIPRFTGHFIPGLFGFQDIGVEVEVKQLHMDHLHPTIQRNVLNKQQSSAQHRVRGRKKHEVPPTFQHTSSTLLQAHENYRRNERRGKREIPEKPHRTVASSGTIPARENPGATPPGIQPSSTQFPLTCQEHIPELLLYSSCNYCKTIGRLQLRHEQMKLFCLPKRTSPPKRDFGQFFPAPVVRERKSKLHLCKQFQQEKTQGRGETGDPRENTLTNGIVQNDSHLRKFRSGPTGERTRFALVGGEQSNRLGWSRAVGEGEIKMAKQNSTDREGAGGLRVRGRGHSTLGCNDGPAERLVSCVRARRSLVARADSWESRSLVCSGGGGETGGGRKHTRRGDVSPAGIDRSASSIFASHEQPLTGRMNCVTECFKYSFSLETIKSAYNALVYGNSTLLRAHCFASRASERTGRKVVYDSDGGGKAMTGFELQTRAADPGCIVSCIYLKNALDY